MDTITVKPDIVAFEKRIAHDLGKSLPFAVKRALDATAFDIKRSFPGWTVEAFDRPTRFTKNASRVVKAHTKNLVAEVFIKDPNSRSIGGEDHYLMPQIRGGGRLHTPFEKRMVRAGIMRSDEWAMPGKGLKLDRFGNVPRGIYAKVVAQVGGGDAGYNSRETEATRSKRLRRGGATYFVATGGGRAGHLPRGIWARDGRGNIAPIFVFVSKAPSYTIRFPWQMRAERIARVRMPHYFRRFAREELAHRRLRADLKAVDLGSLAA